MNHHQRSREAHREKMECKRWRKINNTLKYMWRNVSSNLLPHENDDTIGAQLANRIQGELHNSLWDEMTKTAFFRPWLHVMFERRLDDHAAIRMESLVFTELEFGPSPRSAEER